MRERQNRIDLVSYVFSASFEQFEQFMPIKNSGFLYTLITEGVL